MKIWDTMQGRGGSPRAAFSMSGMSEERAPHSDSALALNRSIGLSIQTAVSASNLFTERIRQNYSGGFASLAARSRPLLATRTREVHHNLASDDQNSERDLATSHSRLSGAVLAVAQRDLATSHNSLSGAVLAVRTKAKWRRQEKPSAPKTNHPRLKTVATIVASIFRQKRLAKEAASRLEDVVTSFNLDGCSAPTQNDPGKGR